MSTVPQGILYKGKIIYSYLQVAIEDRPSVFSWLPQHWWWMHNNPSFNSRGKDKFDLSNMLPQVDSLDTQINRRQYAANKAVLEEIAKDADPYIPYDSGGLARSVYTDAYNGILGYSAYYAGFAFEPNTPMGTPKVYNKEVHTEARGFPVEYTLGKNERKYMDLWVKEVLTYGE